MIVFLQSKSQSIRVHFLTAAHSQLYKMLYKMVLVVFVCFHHSSRCPVAWTVVLHRYFPRMITMEMEQSEEGKLDKEALRLEDRKTGKRQRKSLLESAITFNFSPQGGDQNLFMKLNQSWFFSSWSWMLHPSRPACWPILDTVNYCMYSIGLRVSALLHSWIVWSMSENLRGDFYSFVGSWLADCSCVCCDDTYRQMIKKKVNDIWSGKKNPI